MLTSPLSIGITTNTLAPGGAEMQRVLLANQLAELGHHVTLFCLQSTGKLEDLVDGRVSVQMSSPIRPAPGALDAVISGTTNTEVAFSLLTRVSKRRGLKWLLAIHNPMGAGTARLPWPARLGLHAADIVVGLTPWHAREIADRWSVQVDTTISNGVDLRWSAMTRRARAAASPEFDVGFIGRLSADHKGLDRLILAMAEEPAASLKLAIAGEGPDRDELRELARTLSVDSRVHWLGHQDAPSFLARIGALAVLSRREGQPMVLLEAHAADVPVVASADAGASANDRTWVVEGDDPSAVASSLAWASAAPAVARPSDDLPMSAARMAQRYVSVLAAPTPRLPRVRRRRAEGRRGVNR